mgnify:CR=1 FL=1
MIGVGAARVEHLSRSRFLRGRSSAEVERRRAAREAAMRAALAGLVDPDFAEVPRDTLLGCEWRVEGLGQWRTKERAGGGKGATMR